MKITFRYLIFLVLVSCSSTVLFNGCTKASFKNYYGKEFDTSKKIKVLEGKWTDSNQSTWEVKFIKEKLPIKLKQTRRGKQYEYRAILTEIEKEVIIVWIQDKKKSRFNPFRIIQSGSDNFVLLAPDGDEIKKLVDAGKIKGEYKNDEWLLEGK